MDQPKIPTLKDSKKPQVKVRGLGGVTLFERLKQFKKKDLAFILAGLCTLLMAPLAEHFMMAPENGDSSLSPGWGGHGGSGSGGGIFDGHSPYEGSTNMAPGSAIGGGSDVITPLNARDPSALIMGPGSAQQPPTSSAAPVTQPVASPTPRPDSDYKDALAASGAHAASAALKKAPLPMPKIALSGSNLRGLGVAAGGSSASASLGPVSSAGLAPNKAAGSNSLTGAKTPSGYAGVARGPGQGGNPNSLEALKKAGDAAGGVFNRSGSATNNATQAASQQIPGGGSSFGGNGQGGTTANDKAGSGNSEKDSKSTGESLAYQLMKENAEKQLELHWKEVEAGDMNLEGHKIANSAMESLAGALAGGLGNWASNLIFQRWLGSIGGGAGTYACSQDSSGAAAQMSFTPGQCQGAQAQGGSTSSYSLNGGVLMCGTQTVGKNCWLVGGNAPKNPSAPKQDPAATGKIDGNIATTASPTGAMDGIRTACTSMYQQRSGAATTAGAQVQQIGTGQTWMQGAEPQLNTLAMSRYQLTGSQDVGGANSACQLQSPGDNVPNLQTIAINDIQTAMRDLAQNGVVNQTSTQGSAALAGALAKIQDARTKWSSAGQLITSANSAAQGVTLAQEPDEAAYHSIASGATQGKGAIDAEARRLGTQQDRILRVLMPAEDTVLAQQNGPTNIAQAQATDPTVKQVLAMNTMATDPAVTTPSDTQASGGLGPVIADYNTHHQSAPLVAPHIPDAAAQSGGASPASTGGSGAAGPSPITTGVNQKTTLGGQAILTACGNLGYPNCRLPAPTGAAAGTPTQATVDAVITPITDARAAQLAGLSSIGASATALSGSGNPTGVASTTGTPATPAAQGAAVTK